MGGCSAVNCNNSSTKGKRIFKFPSDPIRRKLWIVNCRRGEWTPGVGSALCEDHFEESQFEAKRADNWKRLKLTAIPTIFNVTKIPKPSTENSNSFNASVSTNGIQIDVSQELMTDNEPKMIVFQNSDHNNMANFYFYQLDETSKQQYRKKLEYNGISLPDPLDIDMRQKLFKSMNPELSPNITFGDIYIYLVETEHAYTREEFKNYKNLNCYTMVLSEKVGDIMAYKCDHTEMFVLTCDVQSDELATKLCSVWTAISSKGVIENSHCTCMSGSEKVCQHVAALLLSIENALKEDHNLHQKSKDSCSRETSPKRNNTAFNGGKERNNSTLSTVLNNSDSQLSFKGGYKKRLREIRKIVPNAPIFTVLSDSDFSSTDEEDIVTLDSSGMSDE